MLNPNQPQLRIIENNHRYTKHGAAGGAATGVLIGAVATEGAVIGGALGAPFGGVGAIPGAVIGAIAGVVVGIFGGAAAGKAVDHVVSREVHEIAVEQARQDAEQQKQRQQINALLIEHGATRAERDELKVQNAHLVTRLDETLGSIQTCNSPTHHMLRMSLTGIPDSFICPITREIFRDPVTLKLREANGSISHKTYERDNIIKWKNSCVSQKRLFTDPMTRLPIINDPVHELTDEIKEQQVERFLQLHPEHYREQHPLLTTTNLPIPAAR